MARTSLDSWGDLDLTDLFYAFRKAKADCFFERSICIAREFVEYEIALPDRLAQLLNDLRRGIVSELLMSNLGKPRVVAKKLSVDPRRKRSSNAGHGYYSDAERAFERLCEGNVLIPEFRLIGDFPVTMHVLSALWVNLVGHKFDAALSTSAYGSRLRRYKPESGALPGTVGKYHIEAIGSFQPYYDPYKRWRSGGLEAIRSELEKDGQVIAMSLDFASYYHQIDCGFLADPSFLKIAKISLTPWELSFTKVFVEALGAWSNMVADTLRKFGGDASMQGGVPIGLTIARLAANVLLLDLDRDISQGLAPIYYGRYVDDIFLVVKDPGNITSSAELLSFIAARTNSFPKPNAKSGKSLLTLRGNYQATSRLEFQPQKQKAFFLKGRAGLDLLDNIESQIRSVSSERRLMPSPDRLESMASAKVLTAAGHAAEEADTLRRADGLAVRRLGWSIQLRSVEILCRDLKKNDWKEERTRFFEFARNHILRPDKILDHADYLPRLLSIAVGLAEWSEAMRLVKSAMRALHNLKRRCEEDSTLKINGVRFTKQIPSAWDEIEQSMRAQAREAILRSIRWYGTTGEPAKLTETARGLCEMLELAEDQVYALALSFRETDWAKVPYKDHIQRDAIRERPPVDGEDKLRALYTHDEDLREFLRESEKKSDNYTGAPRIGRKIQNRTKDVSFLPYLFPTRPYTTEEISLFLPDKCVFAMSDANPARTWARYVRAVRGVWVWGALVADNHDEVDSYKEYASEQYKERQRRYADLGGQKKSVDVMLGISSLLTTDESWNLGASNSVDLSRERYRRIERVVNEAIAAYPRPTHLLLPELSLPDRWIRTVSGLLRESRISLIAGLDYQHHSASEIYSEAVLVLQDERLGFPAFVQIRQPKSMPAPGEEFQLKKIYGKVWPTQLRSEVKPIYRHRGFYFGVLVCSELQNVKHRLHFQGEVDCLMVLSWNKDLETFSSLVESASLDVHAYIALVNNRAYGDSRIRVPAKQQFDRDLCRIRGGKNEHVVVEGLDVKKLREFQSRDTRWPADDDPFKPLPEDFKIAPYRKTTAK
jgi:hypothetical protein